MIAGTFFRTGDIESWGRGIDNIRDACKENESDFPTFEAEPTGMMVEFEAQVPKDSASEKTSVKRQKDVGETPEESSPKSSPKTEERILELIVADNAISTERMGEILDISKRAVLKQTRKLQDQKRLKRIGPAKGGHWEVLKK